MNDTIKVFVGTDSNCSDLESQAVLEWSLRKHTKANVEIEWMMLSRDKDSFWYSSGDGVKGWNTTEYATPFSAFRWGIPARCDFKGKAIYMDSDMIVLSDIADLWNQDFHGKPLISKGSKMPDRFCVTLFDNEKIQKYMPYIDEIRSSKDLYKKISHYFAANHEELVTDFVGNWNCIDGENLPMDQIDIFHHSAMNSQLCHKYSLSRLQSENRQHWYTGYISDHPRKDARKLFDDLLVEAYENGYTLDKYNPIELYGSYKKEYQNFIGNANQYA